jgi:hypothetical protein
MFESETWPFGNPRRFSYISSRSKIGAHTLAEYQAYNDGCAAGLAGE